MTSLQLFLLKYDMPEQIVTLENVKKIYRTGDTTITALDSTTISFETNKLTLIMGPSGSGKTTLYLF
ncbi:AAA family ATPase [Sphingobacterium sp. KU25419]|nr:AAA family ATPase [Sphingobacterium sp. KU25419]